MGRLDGKVVLITGHRRRPGSGCGARCSHPRGRRSSGAISTQSARSAVAAEIRAGGGDMHSMAPVDLADPDAATAWVEGAAERAGGIDVLYNNASAPRVGPFAELSWDDWRFTLHNELDLIFTVTSAAWPHLIARGGGTVINTASVSAHRGATFIEQAAHGAAKGGVLAITRHLAAAGARHNIRANSISPGLIVTPQIEPFLDEPGHPVHEMLHSHPLGRLGQPDDVARVALFLASEDAALPERRRHRRRRGPVADLVTFIGEIFWRDDPGYEEARVGRVFNARRPDRYPAAVLLAECDDDVVAAVRLARDRGLQVSVRAGGHSWAAWSLRDETLLIDLGRMREMSYDPDTGTATASPAVKGAPSWCRS